MLLRRDDGERGASKNTARSECMESRLWGDGGPTNLKKTKGNVISTCVTPAFLYGMDTFAMTELQQHQLQVCKNN